jgi:uncharacterized membrane protein YphA (DoxX/SURF4 family)
MSAATIDKYDIASGEIPRRTHKFVAQFPVRRNICAIGRWDVGWYSTALRLSETPGALRDKSGARQNPDRSASPKNFIIGIPSRSSHDARMKVATIIARVLLGLIFVVFGSNIFLHFIPMPPPPPGPIGDFSKALFVTHYLHVVAVFQIVGGLLLLIGRFVPLGLVLLAPVIVNIDLIHILMEPSGLPLATVVSLLLVFLIWRYRDAFAGIVRA